MIRLLMSDRKGCVTDTARNTAGGVTVVDTSRLLGKSHVQDCVATFRDHAPTVIRHRSQSESLPPASRPRSCRAD